VAEEQPGKFNALLLSFLRKNTSVYGS